MPLIAVLLYFLHFLTTIIGSRMGVGKEKLSYYWNL